MLLCLLTCFPACLFHVSLFPCLFLVLLCLLTCFLAGLFHVFPRFFACFLCFPAYLLPCLLASCVALFPCLLASCVSLFPCLLASCVSLFPCLLHAFACFLVCLLLVLPCLLICFLAGFMSHSQGKCISRTDHSRQSTLSRMPINHFNQPTAFRALNRKACGTHKDGKTAFQAEQQHIINSAWHTVTDGRGKNKSRELIIVVLARS